ncbi:MAG: Tetratricopeptide repeat protein [Euryarchaeota archaeon ADurb.Bin294]|nr:MAG: Tetratricopeptide repeat protein [Euryarchaeota archaeon ADurb.Bin294]
MVPISIAEERKMENIPKQRGQCWIDYLLTRITDLIKIQEYERALHIAEQALLMLPDNPDLIYLASTIYQNLNKFVKELRLLERLRDIRPFDQDTRSALGRSLMFQGYYYSALSVMSHFDMMSNGLAGYNKVFMHYCKACIGDTQSVIEYCDCCIEDYQDEPDAASFLAIIRALKVMSLIQNQENEAANSLACSIDEEFDKTLFVAYAKGIAARENNNLAAAERFLRLACTSNQRDMRARKDLADLLSVLGHHDAAANIRKEITGFFGPFDDHENPLYRTEELIKSGNLDEAERYLLWAHEQQPDRNNLILPMISLCNFTDRYDSVISYADSLETTPYAWKSVYLKASAYYSAGDAMGAIRCLIAAIARDRVFSLITILNMRIEGYFRDPDIFNPDGMALMILCTDGYDSAIPLFEMLVDTNPDILEYRAFLVYCYILEDKNTDAAICSERLSMSDDPDLCMVRALTLRAAGCLDEAKKVTEKIRKRYPDYLPALNMYVRILVDLDLYRSAYFELLSYQDVLLSEAPLMEVFIRSLIHSGDFLEAATSAFRLIMANPDRPLEFFYLAQTFMHDGYTDAALYAIRESFRFSGFNSETLRLYVKLLLQAASPQEASIFFSECDEYFPNSSEVRYLKNAAALLSGENSSDESVEERVVRIFQSENGIFHGYIGEYRNAVGMLTEEIKKNPADYSLRVALARVLFELRQDREGFHQLSMAIENGEEDNETLELMNAALNALSLNCFIDEYKRISQGDVVRFAKLVYEQAVRLNRFGVRRQAIDVCRFLTGLSSSDPAVLSIKADACRILGDLEEDPEKYEQGIALYTELLSEDPDNPVYLAEKGLLLDNLSRYEEAEGVLVRALELNPDSGIANSALCWCLAAIGQYQEALLYGNKATIQIPDDWGAWNNRGLAKLGLEDFEGAASDFRQAIRCHPGEVIPRNSLCNALRPLDRDDAQNAFVDLLFRFGYMAFSDKEGRQSQSAPDLNRDHRTITGYMDGYW